MYLMDNIYRSVVRTAPLNILCFNKYNESTIINLAKLGHNIYLWPCSWNLKYVPNNVYMLDINKPNVDYIDFAICFDRIDAFNVAHTVCLQEHIPLVTYDLVSLQEGIRTPIFGNTTINIPAEQVFYRHGQVKIAASDEINKSFNNTAIFSIPRTGIDIVVSAGDEFRVLFNNNIPQECLSFLQQITKTSLYGIYSQDPEYSGWTSSSVFLNTWRDINEEMLAAMENNIPVLSQGECGFIEHEVDGFIFSSTEELNALLIKLESDSDYRLSVIENAKTKALKTKTLFNDNWQKIYKYMSSQFYMR